MPVDDRNMSTQPSICIIIVLFVIQACIVIVLFVIPVCIIMVLLVILM